MKPIIVFSALIYSEEDKQFIKSLKKLKEMEFKFPKNPNIELKNFKNVESKLIFGSESLSKDYIYYASSAYCDPKNLEQWNCKNCIKETEGTTLIKTFSNSKFQTFGYLSINKEKKLIIVGFRGTKNVANWMGNFIAFPVKFVENTKVHFGFKLLAFSLIEELEPELKSIINSYPDFNILFTGHSLGGALASISAIYLANKGLFKWEKLQLFTYGAPRVGNTNLSMYLEQKPITISRITSFDDIVPTLPKQFMGYNHFRRELYSDNNGNSKFCNDTYYKEDDKCNDGDGFMRNVDSHFKYWDITINSSC